MEKIFFLHYHPEQVKKSHQYLIGRCVEAVKVNPVNNELFKSMMVISSKIVFELLIDISSTRIFWGKVKDIENSVRM